MICDICGFSVHYCSCCDSDPYLDEKICRKCACFFSDIFSEYEYEQENLYRIFETKIERRKSMMRLVSKKIISGFPGIGKSFFYNNYKDKYKILDSDSSKFSKEYFPQSYIAHIKENLPKVDFLLVSSHKEVRDALVKEGIPFLLVYPDISLKNQYIQRYKDRGSPDKFISLLKNNFDSWIQELKEYEYENVTHLILKEKETLTSVLLNV